MLNRARLKVAQGGPPTTASTKPSVMRVISAAMVLPRPRSHAESHARSQESTSTRKPWLAAKRSSHSWMSPSRRGPLNKFITTKTLSRSALASRTAWVHPSKVKPPLGLALPRRHACCSHQVSSSKSACGGA